jgi:hypothetical protein
MSKKKMIAGLVLCAGTPVMAQVNDVAPKIDAPTPNRPIMYTPEALGDPVAGPYNVENAANNGQLGVDHAFGHFWVTARDAAATNHKLWKYDEAGVFVKAFDQDIASKSSAWGYRDGASDEGANQIYFGWDAGGFAVLDYDPATGDVSVNCTQTIPNVGTVRALARTPAGTLVTKSFSGSIFEFDDTGATLNTFPDPGISAYGAAYDASTDTYWWTDAGGFVTETDATMLLTGGFFDAFAGFTLFAAQGGLDIYDDARSATGTAFVMLGQGTPDEISIFEANAGAAANPSTGPIGCNVPPPPPPPPPLSPCFLETFFASNNGGASGGSIFMDVSVGPDALTIEGLEVNTALTAQAPFQIEMWTRPGTYVGGELLPAEWTMQAIGDGRGEGEDNMSRVLFPTPPVFAANDTFGVMFIGVGTAHEYTNGTGANQAFSNADMSLRLGAAQNTPFGGAPFTPRVWNGRYYYTPAAGCNTCPPCACEFDTSTGPNICDIFDFLGFQNGFVAGDPCAIDLNTSTGAGVGDIFDFLDFQNSFVGGPCP